MKARKKELEAAFDSLPEVLQNLRQCFCLEGAAAGIARQIEDQGREPLTEHQDRRFIEDGWHPFVALTCECGQNLQPDDMVLARQLLPAVLPLPAPLGEAAGGVTGGPLPGWDVIETKEACCTTIAYTPLGSTP